MEGRVYTLGMLHRAQWKNTEVVFPSHHEQLLTAFFTRVYRWWWETLSHEPLRISLKCSIESKTFHRSPEGAKAASYIQDMELREEWQDEEFPRPLPEDAHSPETPGENAERPAPPTSLALSGNPIRKKRLVAPTLSLTLSRTDSADRSVKSGDTGYSAAALSPDEDDTELDINLEALETPSDSESCNFPDSMHELEWEGERRNKNWSGRVREETRTGVDRERGQELEWEDDLPRLGRGKDGVSGTTVMEQAEMGSMELDQVDNRGRRWRRFCVAGQEYHVNMSVLEPYLQVLSHGGYYGEAMNAIITFSSCYLPENTVENYEYVMDNLFRYIVGTLDLMVSEGYVMVYLCSMAPRNKMPAIKWLRQCYTSIDRRLRKDLKGLFVVHPAWYIKALITVVKPFISEKFSRKIRFIHCLQELSEYIPMERLQIPDSIREYDARMNG